MKYVNYRNIANNKFIQTLDGNEMQMVTKPDE